MAGPLPINDINSEQSSAGANQSEPLRVRTAPYQRTCGIDRIKNNPNTYVARLLPINEINSKQLSAANFGLPAADGVNFLVLTVLVLKKKCGVIKCPLFWY